MKKRFITILFLLLAFVTVAFTSCACDDEASSGQSTTESEQTENEHTHSYGEWVVVKEPTCQAKGEKEKKCACGASEKEEIDVKEHVFDANGKCMVCNEKGNASLGLEYKLSSGGDYYIVTGKGTCKDTNIVIPGTYNGLPVKRIDGFKVDSDVVSVVVSEGVETISTLIRPESKIVYVKLPKSLTAISLGAFERSEILELENLSSLEIADKLTVGMDGEEIYRIYNVITENQGESHIKEAEDGYVFFASGGVCYLIDYDKEKSELVLPASYNGQDYKIYDSLFAGNEKLVSVTIQGNVTDIGNSAFYGCTSLERVVLPEKITEIKHKAFWGCESLKEISIPSGVKTVGMASFTLCTALERVTLATGLKVIDMYAFSECVALKEIVIPDTVTTFYGEVFAGCLSLESINIPSNITETSLTFYGCPNLKNVNNLSEAEIFFWTEEDDDVEEFVFEMRDGVPYLVEYNQISETVFLPKDYNGQKYVIAAYIYADSITLTDGIAEIRSNISADEVYVDSIETLLSITKEKGYRFSSRKNRPCKLYVGGERLTDLVIPSGTTNLETGVFGDFELNSITIPKEVETISGSFNNVKCVYIEDLAAWCNIEFSGININPLQHGADLYLNGEKVVDLVIPSGVTKIKDYAFVRCNSILTVSFPEGLKEIGHYAFANTHLIKISLPSTLEHMDYRAFEDCNSIIEIYNPSGFEIIKESLHINCWENVKMFTTGQENGGKIEVLGDYVFYTSGDEVYLVHYYGEETDVVLPQSYNGKNYAIYDYAFSSNYSFYTVQIPQGVTGIGENAFDDCRSLVEIFIPKTVECVSAGAFQGCFRLYRVELENGVKIIDVFAFEGCTSLTVVALPNSLKGIGSRAFDSCTSLVKIEIPGGVEVLNATFYGSANLKEVILHEGTKELKAVFYCCYSLESIELPKTITTIDRYTFYNCVSLERLVLPSGVLTITADAFVNCDNLTVYYLTGSNMDGWEDGWTDGIKKAIETGYE